MFYTLLIMGKSVRETVVQNEESASLLTSDRNVEERVDENEEEEEVKECWWGWVVVLASFLCNMVIDGIGYSFGVLLEPVQSEFDSGVGKVAFVGSILTGVILLSAPVAAAMVNRFGPRITCISGSFISAAAMLASSYSNSLSMLMISYSIIGGIGLGLMYVPAVIAVGQYFSKRLNLATGIAVCGSGAGTFIFAPLSSFLVQSYGWRGCNQVMAGLCLLCSVFGLVMVPVKRRSQAVEKTKLIDFEIFKNLPFVLYMVGQIPTVMAVYCTYSYIPSMATNLGFSAENASFLISVVGITNTVGRVLSGWITDIPCISPMVVTIVGTMIAGIFPVLLPIGGSFVSMMVICGFFGFAISALPTVTTGVIVEMLSLKQLNSAFGALTFVRGTAALLGPPAAGFILDHFNDYSVPFTFSTTCLGVALVFNSIVWCVVRHSRTRRGGYEPL